MAAATHMEIESFISKFAFLSSYGFVADLHFTMVNGQVKVNLQASLGDLNASTMNSKPQSTKPSKIRRRLRRQEKRINSKNTSFAETDNSCSNAALVLDQLTTNAELSSTTTGLDTTSTKQEIPTKDETTSSTTNHCECHAAVQAAVTVQDSASQMNPDINATELPLNHLPYPHIRQVQPVPSVLFPSTNFGAQQCSYCDREFASWNDFLEHVKTFRYMCNNCLDYFPEKPWFRTPDLVMIGSVRKITTAPSKVE